MGFSGNWLSFRYASRLIPRRKPFHAWAFLRYP
jgi:hypothetical protein